MTLYTYTIPVDDGAAPNPFNGLCTLAICKPQIRRFARVGDWVAGLGSKQAPSGDISGRLVYAMRVEEVLSLEEYDRRAPECWPHRIPDIRSRDLASRLGDCIYSFRDGRVLQRPGVHGPANVAKDLSGLNALISTDFYYFGRNAVPLPPELRSIMHQGQGHKSRVNNGLEGSFVSWLRGLRRHIGQVHGWPDFTLDWQDAAALNRYRVRAQDDDDEC